jgi:periplasmic protein TonB
MTFGQQNNSEETLGAFRGCLVEGDSEQGKRERRIRRRALAISIALQSAAVAAALLVPLFGKTERLVLAGDFIPLPPYHYNSSPAHRNSSTTPRRPSSNFNLCLTCPVYHSPTQRQNLDETPQDVDPLEGDNSIGSSGYCSGCINMPGPVDPRSRQTQEELTVPKKRLQVTHLDPAMLIHRVEPIYPPLAKQTGRGGRVELRAIIATDGSIQSLQVVSGDPLFIQSALQAVQQWRYKSTILNDHAVEIDTFITVVYNINR